MYLAIDDYVYDVTRFADLHPGGAAVLRMVAGTECTEQFYALHNKEVLTKYHDKFCVGVLADGAHANATTLKLPEKTPEELVSMVPYTEMPMMRANWTAQPWWTDSHRQFLLAIRHEMASFQAEFNEVEGSYVAAELQQKFGKRGLLACTNGMSVMPVAQKLFEEGKMSFPGGIAPKDFDHWHEYITQQEVARNISRGVVNGLIGGMVISLPAISQFATNLPPAKKTNIVEEVLLGNKRSCLAISEPQAGSDVAKVVTTARKSKDGRHYIVNGIKKWITSGMTADYFSTAVRTGKDGMGGLSFLIIDKSDPVSAEGIEVKHIKTSDSKTSATAWVYFDNCYVPVENLMGEENQGFLLMMANFNHERWGICVGCLGAMRTVLNDCFLWAKQRMVFGKPLIQQPVIRNKLGKIIAGLEALEGYMESITFQMSNMDYMTMMKELGGPIGLLKYETTRTMTMVSDEACQIFGGRALTASGMGKRIEELQRTFKFNSILGGSEEIMVDLGVKQAMRAFKGSANQAKL
jgi:alkylation response protein AidB-like acyl-CoA dehydrogenase